jgi:hypothetical protein
MRTSGAVPRHMKIATHRTFKHHQGAGRTDCSHDLSLARRRQPQSSSITDSPQQRPLQTHLWFRENGERRVLRLASSIAAGTPVSLSDALAGIDDRNAILAVGRRPRRRPDLADHPMTADLAELLTVLDEFLHSSEEVTALPERFLAGCGEQHPGYHASLLIDWAPFTALRHRQLAGHETSTPA